MSVFLCGLSVYEMNSLKRLGYSSHNLLTNESLPTPVRPTTQRILSLELLNIGLDLAMCYPPQK
jgi:hypothetical protein